MGNTSVTKDRSSPVPRPESFRASCDGCAKSKVRCGKEQPQCQRCIYQGVRCIYSPSQRSRKRRPSSLGPISHKQQIPAPACTLPQITATPVSPPQSEAGNPSALTFSIPARCASARDLAEIEKSQKGHQDSFNPLNLFDTELDNFMKLDYPVSPIPHSARNGASALSDHFQTQQWLQSNPIDSNCLDDDDMQDIFTIPDLQTPEPSIQQRPTISRSNSGLNVPVGEAAHQHWPSLAFSTLQSLDIPTTCCSSFMLNLDSTSTSGSSRSLDTVLRVNQAAIDNLLTILNCPCTADSNLALLVTIIIFKILSWYEASLHCSTAPGENSTVGSARSNSPLTSSCGTHDNSPTPAVESVFMPPISIGAYQLDAEHRGRMVAQLILTELIKLNKVVDGFSQKYGRGGPMSTEDSKTQLHFALEMFLRSRLKMTILTAKEQLDKN
jgi:Aflatoxin regulatory protein/Fungal Zn(2)-Cys(6) binuclear cluster domain